MAGTIRARYANGVLEPLQHLDVPEGEVLTITIIRLPAKGLCTISRFWTFLLDLYRYKLINSRLNFELLCKAPPRREEAALSAPLGAGKASSTRKSPSATSMPTA